MYLPAPGAPGRGTEPGPSHPVHCPECRGGRCCAGPPDHSPACRGGTFAWDWRVPLHAPPRRPCALPAGNPRRREAHPAGDPRRREAHPWRRASRTHTAEPPAGTRLRLWGSTKWSCNSIFRSELRVCSLFHHLQSYCS